MTVHPVTDGSPLLTVSDLIVEFSRGRRRPPLRALDGVSFAVDPYQTLGVVGESGSGKTTLGRAILGLTPITHGTVSFAGVDITQSRYKVRRQLSAELQVIFQDPYSSLNPTRTIGQTLAESLRVDGSLTRIEKNQRIQAILERVDLPADAVRHYPIHFSGGQRQRIAIARALIVRPSLVICDEPVSALDLSIQAQVLNLLRELQQELGVAYLFIAHDLDVVRHVSHQVVVLYRGRIMEQGPARLVYRSPAHPYTRALIEAAPVPDPAHQAQRRHARSYRASPGESLSMPPNACPFAPRCPFAIERCRTHRPILEQTPDGSLVACHRWQELYASSPRAANASVSNIVPRI